MTARDLPTAAASPPAGGTEPHILVQGLRHVFQRNGQATQALDGVDLAPLFSDASWHPDRDLHWRMLPRQQRALRRGSWKYLRVEGHDYLFDLARDERERANLATREPQRLAALREAWEAWAATMPGIPADARVRGLYGEADMPRPSH